MPFLYSSLSQDSKIAIAWSVTSYGYIVNILSLAHSMGDDKSHAGVVDFNLSQAAKD